MQLLNQQNAMQLLSRRQNAMQLPSSKHANPSDRQYSSVLSFFTIGNIGRTKKCNAIAEPSTKYYAIAKFQIRKSS